MRKQESSLRRPRTDLPPPTDIPRIDEHMRQFWVVDVCADPASVVGDEFREAVEAVERKE